MNKEMLNLVTQVAQRFTSNEHRLAVAESCTGGALAKALTDMPGSSRWFDCGYVTYSDAAKQAMVEVKADSLASHGAVSEQVACEMAEGALSQSNTQCAVAITGIAGPDGGSEEKPVGTVWFAVASQNKQTLSFLKTFRGNRQEVRKQAVLFALSLLI